MVSLAWVASVLVVLVDGKLEGHMDKHQQTATGVSGSGAAEQKAFHDQDDIFGAKMCKLFQVP